MVPLILPADPASVTTRVQNGVVTLAGPSDPPSRMT